MVIKKYHEFNNNTNRNICLIPASAHGTNPASAIMAGMKVIIIKCDENGNIHMSDLQDKVKSNNDNLAALMITYPSTHGVFEKNITEITKLIHDAGGQVYMDGANMNAQVGLTNPKKIGCDVCHLNLHKTFAIPHGGGGPGMGPIAVADHLKDFTPKSAIINYGGKNGISSISASPWGSALILTISYAYIKLLGGKGLKKCTEIAILNANYLKQLLEKDFQILYTGENNTVAHEMIIDCREFKHKNITVSDIAKRLMDYGFHAPTVSFPVHGTMMIEPTESESKKSLDRFYQSMHSIKNEIIQKYKINPQKISTIFRGVDTDYFIDQVSDKDLQNFLIKFSIDREKKIILYPARLTAWKGQIDILKVARKITKDNLVFYFVGDTKNISLYNLLQNKISDMNLENKCQILGNLTTKELKIMYFISDLILSTPNRPEGFGRIISEALSMKKMILAFNYGGVKDQLNTLDSIYKVEPLNYHILDKKINTILSLSEEEKNNLSRKGREHVVKFFSKKEMVYNYKNFYESKAI